MLRGGGGVVIVYVSGVFRIFFKFYFMFFPLCFFPHADQRSTPRASACTSPRLHKPAKKKLGRLFDANTERFCAFRGGKKKISFASHLHRISIPTRIPTLTHSSASFATTCSSTFMFIHPSVSQTYNQITNLCNISTFKQVETGNKTQARQKRLRG